MKQQKFIPSFAPQRVRGATSQHKKFLKDDFIPKYTVLYNQLQHQNIVLEIGSGNGETAVNFAFNNPEVYYIGSEVFLDGVIQTAGKAFEKNLTNLHFFMQDARELLEQIPQSNLSYLFLFFPDPWPKKKHHKRRILNNKFLELVFEKLKPNGELLVATDHSSYKEYIFEVANNQNLFKFTKSEFPNWWVQTKYQKKALSEGRESSFFKFTKANNT